MPKIVSVIGARPQFIKFASVSRAIKKFNQRRIRKNLKFKEIVLHTGQHYDYNMNDIFFKELTLKNPDYYLGVGSCPAAKQVALMLEGIGRVLKKEAPDLVLVFGDTNSTLAGALAAKKNNILLAHVEAGLRSYNMNMQEELNRVITDRISDILFCPSKNAINNLAREGIKNYPAKKSPRVFLVGDVMYDTILFFMEIAEERSSILEELLLMPKSYYLVTVHRAENTDDRACLKSILEGISDVARNSAPVIFPIHPRTRRVMKQVGFKYPCDMLRIIEPVSYLDMLILEKNARAILTDSGGVQKEAYFLKVPCITLRNETEWTETVELGCNTLTGFDKGRIKKALEKREKLNGSYPKVYGDGRAGEKVINILASLMN